ncbi:MAG: hypothetical protein J5753_07885, partial [Oscillospiraceae bacterium]|nr:hypothetical protein [Oscillospiraceae bacterium]
MIDFAEALAAAQRDAGGRGIGTLGEKTLHLALKYFCAPDPETHERPLGGFVADAVTEDGVFEIQTRGLNRLKPKLHAFLPLCPVTVVHPVIAEKLLIRVDEAGELLLKRRSPKHETPLSAMREIYPLREYLADPRFRIMLCELELAEYSVQHSKSRREKCDRVPVALRRIHMLETPADYAAFLPEPLPDPLTSAALAAALHTAELPARLYLNLLGRMGILAEAGRAGRLKCWKRTGFDDIRR